MNEQAQHQENQSFYHDQEKERFFIVSNDTGATLRVNPTAQEFRIYDLQISGVAATKQRNALAGNRKVLRYELPENHLFKPETSFYTKAPRKFIGYCQFANSKKRQLVPDSMPALDKRKADKPVENVLDQGAKPHYLTTASKPPKRFHGGSASAYGSFRTAAGTNQENIAKLVQDEFNRTHSKRLSKLPSFLSTHMSKFNSSMNTITGSLNSRSEVGTASNWREYNPPHKTSYFQDISSHRVTSDPPSRRKIEEDLADLKERDEDKLGINDHGSFCSTIRERPTLAMQEENPSLKNHTYYIKKLKAQNLVKNLPLKEEQREPVVANQIKGTLNVDIPSPNDLFEREMQRMKQLYPQNYITS